MGDKEGCESTKPEGSCESKEVKQEQKEDKGSCGTTPKTDSGHTHKEGGCC